MNPLHLAAVCAAGVLERLFPVRVPLNDYDLPVQDVEDEVWPPSSVSVRLEGAGGSGARTSTPVQAPWPAPYCAAPQRRPDGGVGFLCTRPVGHSGEHLAAFESRVYDSWPQDFAGAAATQSPGQGDKQQPAPFAAAPHTTSSPVSTPAGGLSSHTPSEDTSAAGVSDPPNLTPAALPSTEWLEPAICEVLATHTFRPGVQACSCYFDELDLEERFKAPHMDQELWREHVAEDMAPHILKAINSFQSSK